MVRPLWLSLIACLFALSSPALRAQDFPTKTVRILVPQTPGGASDALARVIAQKLSEKWAQPVVVENRAGAGGNVGMEVVAQGAPDGHLLLMSYAGSHAINPALYKRLPFDPVKDFAPVATLATLPFVLVAKPDASFKTVSELVTQAGKGTLTFGSAGNGSVNHLLGVMLNSTASLHLVHIPYRGAAAAAADVVSGQVPITFGSFPGVMPFVKSGKLNVIGVATEKRTPLAPEVPTLAESLPGFFANSWYGLFAPAGTPKPIIDRILAISTQVLSASDLGERLAGQGAEVWPGNPDQLAKLVRDELVMWARIVKESGATVD